MKRLKTRNQNNKKEGKFHKKLYKNNKNREKKVSLFPKELLNRFNKLKKTSRPTIVEIALNNLKNKERQSKESKK